MTKTSTERPKVMKCSVLGSAAELSVMFTWCRRTWIIFVVSACAGNHQLHRYTQHDIYQDVPEVWTVGGQQGQHRVRSRFCYRATAASGNPKSTEVRALTDALLELYCCCIVIISLPEPVWSLVLFWKSSQISLRRWKMQLVWHEKSRRIKNWPTRRSPSLLLRWALTEHVTVKVEQTLQASGRTSKRLSWSTQILPEKAIMIFIPLVVCFWRFRFGKSVWAQAKVRGTHLCYSTSVRQGHCD